MLIAASFVLGLFTDLWLLPILSGLVGEVAHFASSPVLSDVLDVPVDLIVDE